MDGSRDRVAYLLRAARRAEVEGNLRVARNLRQMVREASSADAVGWSGAGVNAER